jgi:hypothetical protein
MVAVAAAVAVQTVQLVLLVQVRLAVLGLSIPMYY